MFIREYKTTDAEILYGMLVLENVPLRSMAFRQEKTYVLENDKKAIGFYTIKYLNDNRLQLVHFCVDRKHRNRLPANKLLVSFGETVRTQKPPIFIFNVYKKNQQLIMIVKKVFNIIGCYFVDNEKLYFLATCRREVNNG